MLEYFKTEEQLKAYIEGAVIRDRIDRRMREKAAAGQPGIAKRVVVSAKYVEKPRRRYRKGLPDGVRAKVLERDRYRCTECGAVEGLQIHHIKYRANGGSDEPENLVCLCGWCHYRKHRNEPVGNIMLKMLKA